MANVTFNTEALLAHVREGAARGVLAATEDVRNEAVRLILDTPKTGAMYTRRGVTHQASAPGEPPASDTGRLVNSIQTEYSTDGLEGKIAATTSYAAYLEYGTQHMEARPFMRPALYGQRQTIIETIQRAVASALRGSLG